MNAYFLKSALILAAISFVLQACKKSSSSSDSAASPALQNVGTISFELKTTDTLGNTESHFSVGENFIPTLTITNSASQQDTLCRCLLIESNPNLLGVYTNSSEKYGDSAIFIGKPLYTILGYFIFHWLVIPGDSAYVYAIPWISDTTKKYQTGELYYSSPPETPLTAGQYFIQFTFTYNNTPINLRYNFSFQ